MLTAQQEFSKRVVEIEDYFTFIEHVESGQTLMLTTANAPAYSTQGKEDLLRTLKASAFLLLYNLVESTVTNAIEAIFDEFTIQGTSFDICREEIQIIVLNNLKQYSASIILPQLNQLAIDVVIRTFQKDKIVSGNVDARKIREMAEEYGFSKPAADGSSLFTVKTNRNDLAHGVKSFGEVGRDFPVPDILEIKTRVIQYLNAMLANVASYINQRHYLATP